MNCDDRLFILILSCLFMGFVIGMVTGYGILSCRHKENTKQEEVVYVKAHSEAESLSNLSNTDS